MVTGSDKIRHYAQLVAAGRRGLRNLLVPADHRVDWNDAPSKYNIRLEAARLPLSAGLNSKELGFGGVVPDNQNPFISIEELSDFLLLTAGLLRRKLGVNWGLRPKQITTNRSAIYSRGTASGGGLYPVVIYLLVRDRMGLRPGLYQYDDAHHALTRLRLGSFESTISNAIGLREANTSDLLVFLTARFWKSAFKYHNFSYQVITQDVGACIASMEQVAHALGWNTAIIYWFRDRLLSALLGLEDEYEVPMTVISARKGNPVNVLEDLAVAHLQEASTHGRPSVRGRMYERSKRTSTPEFLLSIHKETLLENLTRPQFPPSLRLARMPPIPSKVLGADLHTLLKHRQTHWGLFRREPPVELEVIKRILQLVAFGVQYKSDLYNSRVALPSLRIALISQNVMSLERGVYDYSFEDSRLTKRNQWLSSSSLQDIYTLTNQNIDQVAAVLVTIGRFEEVLNYLGGRGIRVMNAEAGIAAQRAYIATTALSLGCSAALGFDGCMVSEILGIDGNTEMPLLLIFIGHRCDEALAYDFALF